MIDREQAIEAVQGVMWGAAEPLERPEAEQVVDAILALSEEAECRGQTALEMCGIIRRITNEVGAAGVPFLDDAVSYALQLSRELSRRVTDEMVDRAIRGYFESLEASDWCSSFRDDMRAALEAARSSDDGGGAGAARR